MAELQSMPNLVISGSVLSEWGKKWRKNINDQTSKPKKVDAFDKKQSVNFASFIDMAFGTAIAKMLGDIKVVVPKSNSLTPSEPDCVEVGPVVIIGGIRPQNYDAAYRPDGPRIVFDSKTLNDEKSIAKNWQNMINDLATEATTVHSRFPYAIVVFIVVLPKPALLNKQAHDIIRTLERLGTREKVNDPDHLAESISLIVWNPDTGEICPNIPPTTSNLRYENIASQIEPIYNYRYKGLPPHGFIKPPKIPKAAKVPKAAKAA